jgi:hypothetical protein
MKKSILPFIIACLSLVSSLITIQAAAQENLTEAQVRGIVSSMVHSSSDTDPTAPSSTSLYGPRFEVVSVPGTPTMWFKFDKETGDTWVAQNGLHETVCKQIGNASVNDATRPGEINYQLLVKSWTHIVLLNVNTGKMWEAKHQRGTLFGDFKEVNTNR